MTRRTGSTLLELLVTLAIMAIIASMVTLALRPADRAPHDPLARITEMRRDARSSRLPVTATVVVDDSAYVLTALPDGGVIADSALRLDRLTGERIDARP